MRMNHDEIEYSSSGRLPENNAGIVSEKVADD